MLYTNFLSIILNTVSVLTISGVLLAIPCTNAAQAMEGEGEEDTLPPSPTVSMPKTINPDKARHAVEKIKHIFKTMQARERDYKAVIDAFVERLANPSFCTKLDLIDPFWSSFRVNKDPDTTDPNATSPRARLQEKFRHKNATTDVARTEIQKLSTKAANAIRGFQQFINVCDGLLNPQEEKTTLQDLLDSLLISHLFGVKSTVDTYILPQKNVFSHVSLNRDEIDTYYTPESQLTALNECNYIIDYITPIHILINLGLQPCETDWAFSENLNQYVNGTLTSDNPSLFLLDGYLYKKGMEKAQMSPDILKEIVRINSTTNSGGYFNSDLLKVEVLTSVEKQKAIQEYTKLFQVHRKKVLFYINSRTQTDYENIKKSRAFLAAALNEDSPLTPTISLTEQGEQGRKKKRTRKKRIGQKTSQLQPPQAVGVPDTEEGPQLPQAVVVPNIEEGPQLPQAVVVPDTEEDPKDLQTTQPLEEKKEPVSLTTALTTGEKPQRKLLLTPVRGEERNNTTRISINNKSRSILRSILNVKSRPFTIDYMKALNAMSKIGIMEIQPTRKGDFRKLVRFDSNENRIGTVFAYKPATSTLGHGLLEIYREFIEQQLNDRTDIHLNR